MYRNDGHGEVVTEFIFHSPRFSRDSLLDVLSKHGQPIEPLQVYTAMKLPSN
jgi:hypothetical protein